MAWIKIEVELPEKPEVWQIAGMVNIDADAVVGKLIKVWRWFDAHTESGNAVGVTYALVDYVSGVTGFGEAMALCGWLEQCGSVLKLPNFGRHNGKTAKNRALTAIRVASHKEKSNEESNAHIVTSALPREEKKRDKKKDPARTRAESSGVEIDTWLDSLPADADPIPSDDPIIDYAAKAGIPLDYLELAWDRFAEDYRNKRKRQKDWPATFRNAVKGNWGKLWWFTPDGECRLTTAGEQARRASA